MRDNSTRRNDLAAAFAKPENATQLAMAIAYTNHLNVLPEGLQRCRHCTVRHRAVCGAMDDEQLAKLSAIAHRRIVPAGQVIMSDQESASFFANIISGTIKLTKTTADGRQQIVGLLFPPDFLGRAYRRSNPYFAEAASDLEICVFPKYAFERLAGEYPELEHRLFERALDELDAAREWMLLLGRKTAEEKVADFLHLLARRSLIAHCADHAAAGFELPLSRADIADYLGLTIETVSRQITRLKTSGVIRLVNNRQIEVPDLEALSAVAGRDPPHRH